MAAEIQDLMAIVDRAIVDNQAYAQSYDVVLEVVERADGVLVDVDSLRLLQVFANLLSNASKFAPASTAVEVRVREVPGRVTVSVTDLGPGIPDSFRGIIFDKFSQADASDSRIRGGTGLGLAISKELIERMHGTIGYESTPGPGATFFIDLPIEKGGTEIHD
jgi:signal transduction histidine kinase